jgi:hypothetical protein
MLELIEQAAALDRFFAERNWSACLIGGIANTRWGELRLTRDVDATVFSGFGNEADFIDPILSAFEPRIPEAKLFALTNRVVLARGPSGIGLDIALGGFPFEQQMIERATREELAPGLFARTASAEDLVVMKAFAARPRDWNDIAGIIVRQGPALDWSAVLERLQPLVALKEAPEILVKLEEVRRETADA